MTITNGRTLDRQYREDWRSMNYRTLVTAEQKKKLRSYSWACDTYLDQGNDGACVGHGYAHEAAAKPKVRTATSDLAFALYHEAQKLDTWEGEAYSGTSVLAGAQAYVARKYAGEYRWCLDMEDLITSVGYLGPVVIGVNWYEGMFSTDSSGYVHVSGDIAGGHCVLVRGVRVVLLDPKGLSTLDNVDREKSSFLIHNSWGKGWGAMGSCRISIADMQKLMDEQGDFCIVSKRTPEGMLASIASFISSRCRQSD